MARSKRLPESKQSSFSFLDSVPEGGRPREKALSGPPPNFHDPSPEEIFIGEVIRVLDGPMAPMSSAGELQELMDRNPRQIGFYAVLMDVRNAVSEILDKTNLDEVLRRNRKHHGDTDDRSLEDEGAGEE